MKTEITLLTALLFAIFPIGLMAQSVKVNSKAGKITQQEVAMTSYPLDSSAHAFVLYKSCEQSMGIQDDLVRIEHHYCRLKVLDEDGVGHGNTEIRYYYNEKTGDKDLVDNIKVTTFNLADGKVATTKMDKKSVFDEKYDKYCHIMKFTAPNVKAGSVIEVSYDLTSHRYWDISDFYMQDDIPVNEAFFNVSYPEYFNYSKRSQGYEKVESDFEEGTGNMTTSVGPITFTQHSDTYKAYDLPAMKYEPFSYDLSQYKSAIFYSLRSVAFPGMLVQTFGGSWQDVDNQLLDNNIASGFTASNPLKKETADIMAGSGDDESKIISLWKLVRASVKWDGKVRLYCDKSPSAILKAGTGSNVDMNTLLASVLNGAGYHPELVLVKLRTSGFLLEFSPEIDAFDTYIVRVALASGKTYYIEGAYGDGYLNVLPQAYLVSKARILRREGPEWVDLTSLTMNLSNYYVDAEMAPDGVLTGKLEFNYRNMESGDFKSSYRDAGSEEKFISEFESDNSIKLSDAKFKNVSDLTSDCSFSANYKADANVSGDYVYISPMVLKLFSSDAFKQEKRKFPIEFPYPYSTKYVYILSIPEGYEVDQLPKTAVYSFNDLNSQCQVSAQLNPGNKVVFRVSFKIGSILSLVDEYQAIREYWNVLSGSSNEMIVLKKKAQ